MSPARVRRGSRNVGTIYLVSHASDIELRKAEQGSVRARKAEEPAAASDYKISQEFCDNVCKVRKCLAPSIKLKNVMALFCLCLFNFI